MTKYQQQAEELSQKLWSIACDLRGNMDGAKFKNYILGTIFYSFLSERTEQYMTALLRNETEKKSYKEAFNDDEFRPVIEEMSLDHLGYIIKPEHLFSELVRKLANQKIKTIVLLLKTIQRQSKLWKTLLRVKSLIVILMVCLVICT